MFDRLLIVGLGSIGKRHLNIARNSLPNADIRVLRRQNSGDEVSSANGTFTNLEEACSFLPQVAVIANPAPLHTDIALKLIDLGCHVLIEKPIAHESRLAEMLTENATKNGTVLQVGYNLRFLESMQVFRQQVLDSRIGNVLSIRSEMGRYLPSWRPGTDYRVGVSARKDLGGGVLFELSHELDYLRWIFGEIAWVRAWLGKISALEVDVEDTAHVLVGFQDKAYVCNLTLDFVRHDPVRSCVVTGENGSCTWNGLTGEVSVFMENASNWDVISQHTEARDDSYYAQWNSFLRCIDQGNAPLVGGVDGLATVRVVEAARRSAVLAGVEVAVTNTAAVAT